MEELRERQRTKSRMAGVVYKVGDLIGSRYQVRDIVGSGGAGVVYRVHDQEIDVDIALKVINAKLIQTAEERKLFSKELKQAKKLNHQNIVRIYDEAMAGERVFFTMQFLEGLSLRKIIDLRKDKKQHFTLAEVEPIYNQLCQALDYANKSVLHGDLKPDNILVLPDLLKVTDFGLLRGLPRKPWLAIQKSRSPNFNYLAPEVRLEVEELSPAADIYSLGVILAELLTGQLPDESKPEALSVAKSGLASGVLKIIRRCLLRSPKERYSTAGELYQDLRALLARPSTQEAANVELEDAPPPALPAAPSAPPPVPDPRPLSQEAAVASIPPGDGRPQAQPSEAVTEAPTQRLDIAKHGPRPVVEDPNASSVISEEPQEAEFGSELEASSGSGTFAAIEDEMIEAAAVREPSRVDLVPAPELEVPPLAEEEDREQPGDVAEGEEPTEALDELSSSQIVLVADPRATNVIEVDVSKQHAHIKGPPVPMPAVSIPQSEAPAAALAADLGTFSSVTGSSMPDLAFAQPSAHEPTAAGRLDLGGTGSGGSPVAGDEVVVAAAVGQADPKVIPRSPTLAMPPTNGSSSDHAADAQSGRTPKARPMTRPRMSAFRPGASELPLGGPARPGTRPPGERRGSSVDAEAGGARSRNRTLYAMIGGAVVIVIGVVLAMTFVLMHVFDQRLQEQLRQATLVAQAAKTNEETASRERLLAKQRAEEAAAKEAEAQAQAEAAKKKAETDKKAAEEAEKSKRTAEAADRRKDAEEAAKKEQEARAQAESERKKKEKEEQAQKAAEARETQERAARLKAEEQAERLKKEQAAAETKKDEEARAKAAQEAKKKADDEGKKKTAEEAKKKAEEDAKKKAEEEAKKKAAEAQHAASLAPVAPSAKQECPKGMALIAGSAFMMGAPRNDPERNFGDLTYASTEVPAFCIDYYEAPNGKGRVPTAKVSWAAADKQCKSKGKRLCSEPEWEKACKGPSGLRYPYGNQWDPAVCGTEDDEGNDREVSKSGGFQGCRSGYSVMDLSGNVAEWTSTAWAGGGGYVVKGGSSDRPGYDGRCAARKKKAGNAAEDHLGFRCCAEPK